MSAKSDRLKTARTEAGYSQARDAARAFGWNLNTYGSHENGNRDFSDGSARQYAKAFRVSLPWLVTGEGSQSKRNTATVVGYVGAGQTVYPVDDHMRGAGLDEIETDFPVPDGTVAVVVRGDSMLPRYEDGDIIGYYRISDRPDTLLNRTCIVRLTDERVLIKTLKRGSQEGLFTLQSANASDIEDVSIEWAGEIRFILPRGQYRS